MIYVPRCAQGLIALCAEQTARYSMTGVRVTQEPGGLFRLEATDGRVLGILRGPCSPHPRDLEAARRLKKPQSVLMEAVIDQRILADALKRIPKAGHDGIERTLAVMLSNPAILVAGDSTIQTVPVDGRFPDVNGVIPRQGAPVSFKVNPRYLIDLLKAAALVSETSGDGPAVEILYWARDRPIGVISTGKDGLAFDGVIMPLT